MTKDYIKFLKKSPYRKKIEQLLQDLADNKLYWYDVKKIVWEKDTYRIRIWEVRCIFQVIKGRNYIIDIDTRQSVYKDI